MAFSIRMTEQEEQLAKTYSKIHNISLGEAFKQALFEKIEAEFDLKVAEEAYAEYEQGGKNSRPIDQLWEELDL